MTLANILQPVFDNFGYYEEFDVDLAAQEIDAYMENDEGKGPEYEEIMTAVRKVGLVRCL